jgi:hypothetical protein
MAWCHGIFEMFCFYDSCKDRISEWFRFKTDEDGNLLYDKKGCFVSESTGKHKNPMYMKGGEKKRPKWCKKKYRKNRKWKDMTPKYDCVYDKCPFLSMTEVDKSEYMVMLKAWEKAGKDGAFDHLEGCPPPKSKTPRKTLNGRKPPAK